MSTAAAWAGDFELTETMGGDQYPNIFDMEEPKPGPGRWGVPGTPISVAVASYPGNPGDSPRWIVEAYFGDNPFDRLSHMLQNTFVGLAHCADTLHLIGSAIVITCGETVGES